MILAAAACVGFEIHREVTRFRVVTYKIRSPKLKGLDSPERIVFLSDLHNQEYGEHNALLLEKIHEIQPALILIGGDMFVKKKSCPYEPALRFVQELAKSFPVYYANGNHEQMRKDNPEEYGQSYEDYKRTLERAGVHFVENDSMDFLLEQCRINVTGLEIPEEYYVHFHEPELPMEAVTERIGQPEEDVYQILLAHNPTYMDRYVEWGADLVLSGHLHGGVVRIPGAEGVISPAFKIFPKYSGGYYREKNTDIVVSKGLGVHTIKVRLFNPAEVVVLEIAEK